MIDELRELYTESFDSFDCYMYFQLIAPHKLAMSIGKHEGKEGHPLWSYQSLSVKSAHNKHLDDLSYVKVEYCIDLM